MVSPLRHVSCWRNSPGVVFNEGGARAPLHWKGIGAMRMRTWVAGLAAALGLGMAQAALIARDGGMLYDDVLNITWLQDAYYLKNGGYDANGRVTWAQADAWAANLVFGGFDDWRLPTTRQPDPSCSWRKDTPVQYYGFGCVGSELGYMFHVNLALVGLRNDAVVPQSNGACSATVPRMAASRAAQHRPGAQHPVVHVLDRDAVRDRTRGVSVDVQLPHRVPG